MAYQKPDYIQVEKDEFYTPVIALFVVVACYGFLTGPSGW